jgi:hypothetical protein
MRCGDFKNILEELEGEDVPVAAREHLSSCASCRMEAQDRILLRAGFRGLAAEPIPEPSIGFMVRLLRRLDETATSFDPARDFLERAGRRVMYAGLALTLAVLLALVLPSWSPLHGVSATEFYPAPQVQASESDPVFADDSWVTSHLPDLGGHPPTSEDTSPTSK